MVCVRQEGTATGRVREEAVSRIVNCPDPSGRIANLTTDGPERRSRDRIRNCPQITQINADMKKRNSSSASICVICGQRPFLLAFQWNFEQKDTKQRKRTRHSGKSCRKCAISSFGGTDCTDGDGSRNSRFLSVKSVKSVVKGIIYTNSVYIRCPASAVFSRIFRLFATICRKCLYINHLQPKSPIFQSSPINPNQGQCNRA